MRKSHDHSLNNFARGGQFINNFAVMIHQNFITILFAALIIGVLGTNIYVEKFSSNWERTLYVQEQMMKIEHSFNKNTPRKVRLERGGEKIVVNLKDRMSVQGYKEDIERIGNIFKIGGIIGILTALLIMLTYIWASMALGDKIGKDKHLRGSKLTSKDTLSRQIKTFNRIERKRINYTGPSSYNICGVPYPLGKESNHLGIFGTTGAGKSQSLSELLGQIKERGDRAVIYDKMCSFPSRFYNPKTDILLNPIDERSPAWDIFNDCRHLIDWTNIADIIWPDDEKNVYFIQAARQVFQFTALRYTEQCKNRAEKPKIAGLLHLLMNTTDTELHDLLIGTPGGQHVDPEAQKQTAGVLGTINNGLRSFGYLKDPQEGEKPFSIREWIEDENRDGLVFLTSRADHHAALKPLITMWISIFVNALQSQQRSNERKVWFLLDELPSLGKLNILENALAEARQFGACFAIGTQTISQLKKIYGQDGADTILALTRTKLIFNSGDSKTAEYCSDFIGSREINQKSTSFTMGRNAIRDGQGVNEKNHTEKIIMPEELLQLKDLHCILSYPGSFPVAPLEYEYLELDGPQPTYIEDPHWIDRVSTIFSDKHSVKVRKERFIRNTKDFHSERPKDYGDSLEHQVFVEPQTDEDKINDEGQLQNKVPNRTERPFAPLTTIKYIQPDTDQSHVNETSDTDHQSNSVETQNKQIAKANENNLKVDPVTGEIIEDEVKVSIKTHNPNDNLVIPKIEKTSLKKLKRFSRLNNSPSSSATKPKSANNGGVAMSPYTQNSDVEIYPQNTMPYDKVSKNIKTRSSTIEKPDLKARRILAAPAIHQEEQTQPLYTQDNEIDI